MASRYNVTSSYGSGVGNDDDGGDGNSRAFNEECGLIVGGAAVDLVMGVGWSFMHRSPCCVTKDLHVSDQANARSEYAVSLRTGMASAHVADNDAGCVFDSGDDDGAIGSTVSCPFSLLFTCLPLLIALFIRPVSTVSFLLSSFPSTAAELKIPSTREEDGDGHSVNEEGDNASNDDDDGSGGVRRCDGDDNHD
nr:unnamed protein product [Spirometra erinaceieuropaei]